MTSAAVESGSDINLTPMLDVVFIMLIFFLVVASFAREFGLDVNQSNSIVIPPVADENILISIENSNDIRVGDRLVDARALRANIARLHAENPAATVVIRAEKRSANKTLVQVMDASRQAGVYDISLASPHD